MQVSRRGSEGQRKRHTLNKAGKLSAPLDTTECTPTPGTTSDELESSQSFSLSSQCALVNLRARRNLVPCRCNTNDRAHAPSLMGRLERRPHHLHVTRAVKREIEPTVGDVNEVVLDALALRQRKWVDEVGGTELGRPRLLGRVGVNSNDTRGADLLCGVDDAETNCTDTEDGHGGVLWVPKCERMEGVGNE